MSGPVQTDPRQPRFLDFPYAVGGGGTPRTTTADDHLRDLIVQVLFTNPGERVNVPDFGVGVQRLVFVPNNETLRTSAQFLITTSLQRWLGDRITIEQVGVASDAGVEHVVTIEIAYTVKATQQSQSVRVQV